MNNKNGNINNKSGNIITRNINFDEFDLQNEQVSNINNSKINTENNNSPTNNIKLIKENKTKKNITKKDKNTNNSKTKTENNTVSDTKKKLINKNKLVKQTKCNTSEIETQSDHLVLRANEIRKFLKNPENLTDTLQAVSERKSFNVAKKLTICTYNVRTLLKIGKFDDLCSGCSEQNLDFIAIQEHRWPTDLNYSKIHYSKTNHIFIFSSGLKGQGGVGLLMKNKYNGSIKNRGESFLPRILAVTFSTVLTHCHNYFSLCTNRKTGGRDAPRNEFYKTLQDYIDSLPVHNIITVVGDFNARIGRESNKLSPSEINRKI